MGRAARAGCAEALRTAGFAVVAVLLALGAPSAEAEDVAFPLSGRQIVKANGKRYVIDGKQTIASGALIRVEAGVKIAGLNHASLEVKGGLRVHGTQDGRVEISAVDFGPTVEPENEIHFDEVDLSGCDFATPEGASFSGGFTIENASVSNSKFAMRMKTGYLRMMSVKLNVAGSIEAVPDKGRPPEIAIRTSTVNDLTLLGNALATVRSVDVKGRLEARDFTDLVVDGCHLRSGAVFRQGPEGSFAKLQLLKCNLLDGSTLVLARPKGPNTKMEKVRLDKFHFGTTSGADLTDKQIAERIQDGADDESVSVKAWWQNPQERPH